MAGSYRPCSRSSRSAALTAYPMMIDGARRTEPAIMHAVTAVTSGPLKPMMNAVTKQTIAIAHNKYPSRFAASLMREIVCRRERTGSLLDWASDIPMMVGDEGLKALVVRGWRARVW